MTTRSSISLFLTILLACGALACGDDSAATDTGMADGGADTTPPVDGGDDASSDAGTDTGDDAGDDAGSDTGADAPVMDSGFGTAMSFFVSSSALTGDGDLGGLAAADAHCVALAGAAGAVRSNWVAYLSTSTVNAIDRIGTGPWYNADEEVFSTDLVALHPTVNPEIDRDGYIAVKPADELFMDENGAAIAQRDHDIFTGTTAEGTVFPDGTCQDWTSNSDGDFARVGHSDTPGNPGFSPSWNSAHDTVDCTSDGVEDRGGAGFIYCFATD